MSIPGVPSLTLTVTPPGGSPSTYTQYFTWGEANQQGQINQNFGRQGDTAVLPLVEDFGKGSPAINIPVMSQVSLFDNSSSTSMFAGVVNDPVQYVVGPTMNEWDLNCTDYTFYADNAIVHGIFYGFTVDEILISLTQQANCGISAVKSISGGFVNPGPQLASFVYNYGTLSDAWRQLAALASSVSPYGWYVDQNLELHFFDSSSAISSGVTFTYAPAAAIGSTTEGHFKEDSTFQYEWDGQSVKNRVLVQGANLTVSGGSPTTKAATDTFVGNGNQNAWPLRYTVSSVGTLEVNGVKTAVVLATAGTTDTTDPWVVQQNSVGSYFLIANGVDVDAGVVLKIWYTYQVPVVAQAQDTQSQTEYTGPNSGVFAEFISDTSLTTVPMALAYAQQQRTEYAFAAERITFNTGEEWWGWVRAGQTCVINNGLIYNVSSSSYGIVDTFIVVGNTVTIGGDNPYWTMQLTAVRI